MMMIKKDDLTLTNPYETTRTDYVGPSVTSLLPVLDYDPSSHTLAKTAKHFGHNVFLPDDPKQQKLALANESIDLSAIQNEAGKSYDKIYGEFYKQFNKFAKSIKTGWDTAFLWSLLRFIDHMFQLWLNGSPDIHVNPGNGRLTIRTSKKKFYESLEVPRQEKTGRIKTWHRKQLIEFMERLANEKNIKIPVVESADVKGTYPFKLVSFFNADIKDHEDEIIIEVDPIFSRMVKHKLVKHYIDLPIGVIKNICDNLEDFKLPAKQYLKPAINLLTHLMANKHNKFKSQTKDFIPINRDYQELLKAIGIDEIKKKNIRKYGSKNGPDKAKEFELNLFKLAKKAGWIIEAETTYYGKNMFFKVAPDIATGIGKEEIGIGKEEIGIGKEEKIK